MVNEAFPILKTPDIERALGFYQGLLDAQVEYRFPDDGDPAYVGLAIGRSRLGLAADPEAPTGPNDQRMALWIYVRDCDEAFHRLEGGGGAVVEPPTDQPWGERVARVRDHDGNELIIGAGTDGEP